jgi:hypothetical protein
MLLFYTLIVKFIKRTLGRSLSIGTCTLFREVVEREKIGELEYAWICFCCCIPLMIIHNSKECYASYFFCYTSSKTGVP